MQTKKYDSPRIEILGIETQYSSCLVASNADTVDVCEYYGDNDFDY